MVIAENHYKSIECMHELYYHTFLRLIIDFVVFYVLLIIIIIGGYSGSSYIVSIE